MTTDTPYQAFTAWLASLKPGDEVVMTGSYGDELRRVHNITPSGRIVVDIGGMSSIEFNADGYERGSRGSFHRKHLVEPTQARRDRIEARELRMRIERQKWQDVPLETLRQIVALLGEG